IGFCMCCQPPGRCCSAPTRADENGPDLTSLRSWERGESRSRHSIGAPGCQPDQEAAQPDLVPASARSNPERESALRICQPSALVPPPPGVVVSCRWLVRVPPCPRKGLRPPEMCCCLPISMNSFLPEAADTGLRLAMDDPARKRSSL